MKKDFRVTEVVDEFSGQGGSYTVDASGKRVRTEEATKPAPTLAEQQATDAANKATSKARE